jgi:probable rRNA maturation factor
MTEDPPQSRFTAPQRAGAAGSRRGERVVVNRQRAVTVRPRPLRAFLARACNLVLPPAAGVAVCFVSDAEIARLNRAYRGKTGATDVLSFPADGRGGDIAISPAAARRNARSLGRPVNQELRVLILHGVLHLAGYDHEADQGQMERRERRLRRRLGIA